MLKASNGATRRTGAATKYVLQLLTVGIAYFVAGKVGQATTLIRNNNVGPVWPAYGIALAATVGYGYRVWPAVAVGAFIVAVLGPVSWVAALGQAAGTTLAAVTGAFVLRRVFRFSPSLSRLRDAIALIGVGAAGSALISATIGTSFLYATGIRAWSDLGSGWLIYWLGDCTGVLLVTPLLFTYPSLLAAFREKRFSELLALLLLVAAASLIIFDDRQMLAVKLHPLAFAMLPFVIWAAIRFGVSGAAIANLILAGIATIETALGSGPFALNAPFINAVLLDVFFVVMSITGLTLAAVIAEREHAESEKAKLIRERAAAEARLRLAGIVESSEDAIIGEDMNGMIADWNRGAERLYGYSSEEVIGKPISLLVPNAIHNSGAENTGTESNSNVVRRFETVRQKKDGTCIEVALTISPIRDATGLIVGASSIARDITERKLAEQALARSEAMFRMLVEAAPTAIVVSEGIEERVDFVNRRFSELFGYTHEDIPDVSHWWPLAYPDESYRKEMEQSWRRRVEDAIRSNVEPEPIEATVRCKDGSTRYVEFRVTSIGEKNLVFMTDLTEYQVAEEALRESEERLRVALLAGRMYAFEWELASDSLVQSVHANEVLGLEGEVLRETGVDFVSSIHREDREQFRTTMSELRPADPTYQVSYRVVRPDNSVKWVEEQGRGYFDGAGQLIRVVGIRADVTERIQAEELLRDLGGRLLTAQEEERRRIARELHDSIGQELALLAVQIQRLSKGFHERDQKLADAEQLYTKAKDLGTKISRLSHQLHSSELEYLGLAVAIQGFCRDFSETYGIEVRCHCRDVPRALDSEISLCFLRLVQEALHNVVKHSQAGLVQVELIVCANELLCRVQDDGVGFDVEPGLYREGLGLLSMRERMRLVGGKLSISSGHSRGTQIEARVPITVTIAS